MQRSHTASCKNHTAYRKNSKSRRFLQKAKNQAIIHYSHSFVSFCLSKTWNRQKYKAHILKYMACIFYKMPYVFSDIPHAASHNPKNYKSKRISVQTKTRCKHTGLHLVFALNVPTTLLLLNCPDHNHSIGTIILFSGSCDHCT